ncbi:MAG: type II toxin-antitoxin system HicA family toxin [Candidatus Sericytochromatia bacterium]|nr:type II toxin-antitoxin system HicA family toxin [Candidatus Sericytochromatia bacterium]
MLRFLQENGWVIARITGSHHHMRKDGATVIVAIHGKQEIPKGTQAAILKKAGLR